MSGKYLNECDHCKNLSALVILKDTASDIVQFDEESVANKCQKWLENCSITSDGESVYSSSESTTGTSFFGTEDEQETGDIVENNNIDFSKIPCNNVNSGAQLNSLQGDAIAQIFSTTSNSYGNVSIKKSKKVHMGNITYIKGPIYVNQNMSMINHQTTTNQIYLDHSTAPSGKPGLRLVGRRYWLAQPPIEEPEPLQEPAKFVIISHTATEEGFTQAENVLLIRLIQTFHIESKNWNDIAYNFLIGSDGNVYEGRGWNIIGAHTFGYNFKSVGISFIGCFIKNLPPQTALYQAKLLIQRGVEMGAIAEDYILLGHCQGSAVESPGRTLFAEIRNWKNFDNTINIKNPSPLIDLPQD